MNAAQFWERVARGGPDECWPWQGRLHSEGYGVAYYNGRHELAHRLSYLLARGDLQELCVLHHCDNRPCCNPSHLFLGTHMDNVADMVRKGRHRTWNSAGRPDGC